MPQSSKHVEQLAPELERIISPSEPIQDLADGFGGAQGPAEGPLWWKESRYLLFSDIHNNRRMKYEPGKGVSLFQEPTNRANGLTRDLQGRLIACEHDSRRVTRQELDGSITVVANSFQGRRLNRPILMVTDVLTVLNRKRVIEFAAAHGLPAIYEYGYLTQDGGLMSYGPDVAAIFDRAAELADRILKGANPADLPIELPTRFELAINLKTGKALNLTIPEAILVRADHVIE
jgi:ABC transporter substrate binding protein/SMP-30/Gluconolactonase/LRE-like region